MKAQALKCALCEGTKYTQCSYGCGQEPKSWGEACIKKLAVFCLGTLENPAQRKSPHRDNPVFQLAFTGIMGDMLPNLEGPPEFYDPNFTAVDKALLESLGYKVCNGA
jgi:hypothetical protein